MGPGNPSPPLRRSTRKKGKKKERSPSPQSPSHQTPSPQPRSAENKVGKEDSKSLILVVESGGKGEGKKMHVQKLEGKEEREIERLVDFYLQKGSGVYQNMSEPGKYRVGTKVLEAWKRLQHMGDRLEGSDTHDIDGGELTNWYTALDSMHALATQVLFSIDFGVTAQ